MIQMDKKMVITISLCAVIVVSTNVLQFTIWNSNIKKVKSVYTKQIKKLQATMDRIGPLVDVYTVVSASVGGQKIKDQREIKPIQLPKSMIATNYVLDPSSLVGKVFKIGIQPGTPITLDTLMTTKIEDTLGEQDIVVDTYPIGLKIGDYVDYRIVYPRGEDYIVLAHKRVEAINGKTLKMNLTEMETQLYQSALVDNYIQKKNGCTIYVKKYAEPGIQKEATAFYGVPTNIAKIISANPNIINGVTIGDYYANRGLIEGTTNNIPTDIGSAISSGRNDTNSKVDTGNQAYTSEKAAQKTTGETTPYVPPNTQTAPQKPATSTDTVKVPGSLVDPKNTGVPPVKTGGVD